MKFLSRCNRCNYIRVFLICAVPIIIFLPGYSKKYELTIGISPLQISLALIFIGIILFIVRYRQYYRK